MFLFFCKKLMSKQDKLITNQTNVVIFLNMYVAASADTKLYYILKWENFWILKHQNES